MTDRGPNSHSAHSEPSPRVELCSRSEAATLELGATVARWLRAGDVVLLHGDLGAGKTVLAKGIARGLHIDVPVTSPSFALVNEYATPPESSVSHLSHLDLYRLDSLDDLETIGFSEIVNAPAAISLVEWPERATGILPDRYLLVEISAQGDGMRRLTISCSPPDATWLERLAVLDRLVRDAWGTGGAQ